MKALVVFKTANGYAAMPYTGDMPIGVASPNELRIATRIDKSYSSGAVSMLDVLEDFFEKQPAPATVTELKAAA